MFKKLLLVAAAAFACTAVSAQVTTLWSSDVEEEQETTGWRRVYALTPDVAAANGIAVGDEIVFTVSYINPEGNWPQVALFDASQGWPPMVNTGVGGNDVPYDVKFTVTPDIYKAMSTNGLTFSGSDVRISAIGFEKGIYDIDPSAAWIWVGPKEIGYGNGITIPASVFQNANFGDVLKCHVDLTAHSDRYCQFIFKAKAGDIVTTPWDKIIFDAANELMIFEFKEEYAELIDALKDGGLFIQGPGNVFNYIEYFQAAFDPFAEDPFMRFVGPKECGWGNGFGIDKSYFANVQAGDKIIVKYDKNAAGPSAQFLFGGWSGANIASYENHPLLVTDSENGYLVFTLTPECTSVARTVEVDKKDDEGNVINGDDGKPIKEQVQVNYNLFDQLKNGGFVMHGQPITVLAAYYLPVNKIGYMSCGIEDFEFDNYAGNVDGDWVAPKVALTDARSLSVNYDLTANALTYTRNFGSANWQALYVPYDMAYAEWEALGTVAELVDATKNGDEVVLTWETVESGSLTANKPYIFLPAAAGEAVFAGVNKSVKAAVESSVTIGCATLTGIYTAKTDMASDGAYALSGGHFYRANSDDKVLNPFRIYLTIAGVAPAKVTNKINGEVTGIEGIMTEIPADGTYFDLMGRKIENPTNGLYINGGQKVIIRK